MRGIKTLPLLPAGRRLLSLLVLPLAFTGNAEAVIIASDNFIVGGDGLQGNAYSATIANINGQSATVGTSGYFTGTASGISAPGWVSGTGAFSVFASGSTHPLSPNPAGANDGRFVASGNGNVRIQYRDFATVAPPASTDYYFSALLRQSATSYTATTYIGISNSRAAGANGTVPNTGFSVGFVNGGISLFYGNGTATLGTTSLLAGAAASSTYMAVLHYNVASGTLTPMLYNDAGTLINNPAGQAVAATINTATDLGAFTSYVDAGFTTGGPVAVSYDQFRFGTALSDVMIVPEPSASLLALGGLGGLALARRRTRASDRV